MANQSPEEQFIRALENARRPNGAAMDFNQDTLASALNILASEMNVKPTHYQLELIQNADDNKYAPGVEPTLTLAYSDAGYLWIGCNEVGFDKASVRAICDIGGSTKKATGPQKGYIGEKGIGFKSVFKVADKVWISSGGYQFSLGREGLGMISPVWEKFKSTSMVNEHTMFCLRIPRKEDQIHVKTEMLSLKPELLLFLRKLRTINVVIDDRKEKVTYKFSLRREDDTEDLDIGYTTTELSRRDISPAQSTSSETLVVFRHTTQSMPEEPKRPGIKETEVVLAFPTVFDNASRMTFNFLPIRDFGLPFLLQADFITNVNREDINHHNKWNDALLAAAADQLVQCIRIFNRAETDQMGIFKYKWPQFVKSTYIASDTIMASFIPDLCKRLPKEPILESQAGLLATPASLTVLSERWTDRGTPPMPIFGDQSHLGLYVSEKYHQDELSIIGMKTQSPSFFAALLKKMKPEKMQQKPNEWHCRLAEALLEVPPVTPKSLSEIAMIPLRDGTWVAMDKADNMIYFADGESEIDIPSGVEMRIVHHSAVHNYYRRALMKKLGVEEINYKQVCIRILKRHDELDAPTDDLPALSVDVLVDHARYLSRYSDCLSPKRLKKVKLAVSGSDRALVGTELYMDSIVPNTFTMSQHFVQSEECQFIHPAYFEDIPDEKKMAWYDFLREAFGISTKPQLLQHHPGPASQHNMGQPEFTIHPLFQKLLDLPNSMIWLSLLRDEWSDYKTQIDFLPKNCLQGTPVTCKDGLRYPLNSVYLATTDVMKEPLAPTGVNLFELTDRDQSWRELIVVLGLKTKADLQFYLEILRKAALGKVDVEFSHITALMQNIHRLTDTNQHDFTRKHFKHNKLVAVPYGGSLSWLKLEECMWRAPDCLPGITPLADHYNYDGSESFFRDVLEVYDVTPDNIAEQLDCNDGRLDEVANTKALLAALSDQVKRPGFQMDFDLLLLRRISVFPIWQLSGKRDLVSSDDETWFIADDHNHQKCFQGRVALLDFPIAETARLMPLLKLLGAERRTLSGSVTEDMVFQGTSKYLSELSEELRSKAKYIALLVPTHNSIAVEIQLNTIEVYASKGMQLRRFVRIGDKKVYGANESGKAMLQKLDTGMRLHCRARAIKKDRAPWHFILETMSKVLRIPEEQRETLLVILVTPAGPLIEEILSKKGLWDGAVTDVDDVEEEDDEPEDIPKQQERSTERAENARPVTVEDDESVDDDILFVAEHRKSDASDENSDNGASSPNGTPWGTPEAPQTTRTTPRSSGSRRNLPRVFFKKGPSLAEARAAKKAQREQMAVDALVNAAGSYDMEDVEVHGPPRTATNPPEHLAGLVFEPIQALSDHPDQNDRTRYHGELFVRELLSSYIEASDDAWTSPMRTRQKLGKLEIEELDESSTFTIIGSELCDRITEWLEERGYDARDMQDQPPETYHIYVKATEGDLEDPFSLSNREFELAKDWSASGTDKVLLFRVFELHKDPKFVILVDPTELMQSGKVTMTAIDGFSVSIT